MELSSHKATVGVPLHPVNHCFVFLQSIQTGVQAAWAMGLLCIIESSWRDQASDNEHLWGMITWNRALQAQYPNLIILAKLAHVQCVSTTVCECVFSVQNFMETKVRNKLGNKNLEAMLWIALEGLDEGVDDIINDVVAPWKNDSTYHFCMLIPLVWILPNTPNVSDVLFVWGGWY